MCVSLYLIIYTLPSNLYALIILNAYASEASCIVGDDAPTTCCYVWEQFGGIGLTGRPQKKF